MKRTMYMEDNKQQTTEESKAVVLAKQFKKLNNELENSKLQVFDDNNSHGLVAVQVGTPQSDEEPINWFKVLFSSGNTYLFNVKSYVEFCLKSTKACQKANTDELANLVDECKNKLSDNDNSQLDEAEDEEISKYIVDNSKTQSIIMPIDYTEKDVIDKATKMFKSFASNSSVDNNDDVQLPGQYITSFQNEFLTPRKSNGVLTLKELNTNNKASIEIMYKKMPFAFFYVGYVNNINKEQWQQAFCPIAWSGIKCTTMPKTTKDLDRPNTALSNFDQIISVIDAESEQEDTTIEPEEAQDDISD